MGEGEVLVGTDQVSGSSHCGNTRFWGWIYLSHFWPCSCLLRPVNRVHRTGKTWREVWKESLVFPFAYFTEVVWFGSVSHPKVISKPCLRARAAMLPASGWSGMLKKIILQIDDYKWPLSAWSEESGAAPAAWNSGFLEPMLAVTEFLASGRGIWDVGLLFALPNGFALAGKAIFPPILQL